MPDTTQPAPSAEDVAAADAEYREWEANFDWDEIDGEDGVPYAFRAGYLLALARARQDEGRDAARLRAQKELMDEVFEALMDEYWGRCFCQYSGSGGTVRLCAFHKLQERIDAAMRRAEEEG